MEFKTIIQIPRGSIALKHSDRIALVGSCFTENIGRHLTESKFGTDINPWGIVYNPASVAMGLQRILAEDLYSDADMIQDQGVWKSFAHHSRFAHTEKSEALKMMNERLSSAISFYREAKMLVITFGTAWAYELKENGSIVANCHKLPGSCFNRKLLKPEEITLLWDSLISDIGKKYPDLTILFTISPVRHLKDTAQGNQISKSILHLAIHELQSRHPEVFYFPSYEIQMDELRDYRFYAEDMIHPSDTAIKYIWQRFSETWLSEEARQTAEEIRNFLLSVSHRPFFPESSSYTDHRKKSLQQLKDLEEKFPWADFRPERLLLEK